MGMAAVAARAASLGWGPAVTMTSTLSFTKSEARAGRFSNLPACHRYSMNIFRPSTYPRVRRPWRKRLPFRAVGGAENTAPPYLARLLPLGGEWPGDEPARNGSHEPPASKRMAERFASDRVGHRPPTENAGFAGSLAETEPTLMASLRLAKCPKVGAPPRPQSVTTSRLALPSLSPALTRRTQISLKERCDRITCPRPAHGWRSLCTRPDAPGPVRSKLTLAGIRHLVGSSSLSHTDPERSRP